MIPFLARAVGIHHASPPWVDTAPVREELFGVERLELHARSLAAAQPIAARPARVPSLRRRLDANARVLLEAYRAGAAELEAGQRVAPAAEWLLENYHLVEKQIRQARSDLPANFYLQLPKLSTGPFAGYPRIFGLAWAYVAHTDSHVDLTALRRFIAAYQQVVPLTIGELWAVAITLRIVLIENLRRLADQITAGRAARADADQFANRLIESGSAQLALDRDIALRSALPLSELFAAQLAKRLRDRDPRAMPALDWLEVRLSHQGVTVDDVVAHAQQRQGASNVSVRNIITSLRLMADIDWADLFESVSLVDASLRAGSDFDAMDFPSRNLYRDAIEQLARRSPRSELEIADLVLVTAREAPVAGHDAPRSRMKDPGYHLIAEGRPAIERAIGFRPTWRMRLGRWSRRPSIGAYVATIVVLAVITLGLCLALMPAVGSPALRVMWFLALLLPVTEVATALVNRIAAWRFGAAILPALDLSTGVPASLRTLIAVPTLLTDEAELLEQIERLEVHYLSGRGDTVLALLTDGIDADAETIAADEPLLALARSGIAALNRKHGPAPAGARFLLLHRRRVYNTAEDVWMGWERKRGKLHELNRWLRGATDTHFVSTDGDPLVPPAGVRYVLTLDADTRLPRDAAVRLVGKMAHPLNRPCFDPVSQRVINGYGILQPRITPSLPLAREGSWFQRIASSPGGTDPYAMAVSDVYQDLFGEGSYTGKGIYDVDAFEASLLARVPDNAMLSHDLFEGVYARAGLVSDIELIEQPPARYDVAARRQHRWARGDWQLLPWIFGPRRGSQALPVIGRWKMLDNLRRSLLAPSAMLALAVAWMLPATAAVPAVLTIVVVVALPSLLPVAVSVWQRTPGVRWRSHLGALASDSALALARATLSVTFLADEAWRMGDAIGRTLARLLITRRHLLEWTTAAQSSARPRTDLAGFYRQMAPGVLLGWALALGALALAPSLSPALLAIVLPLPLLWLAAPAIALRISRPASGVQRKALRETDGTELRLIGRRTWRYFETFVTPADHMLPPDNFQETPRPALAHRTSPTNIGLYLLAAATARDLGWAGTQDTIERLEATFATLRGLQRFRGHFFNWYDTSDLRVLDPPYVSSVDSGNLAGHLITLANACETWTDTAPAATARDGLLDSLRLAQRAASRLLASPHGQGRHVAEILGDVSVLLQGPQPVSAIAPALIRLSAKASRIARDAWPANEPETDEAIHWIETIGQAARSHARDLKPPVAAQEPTPASAPSSAPSSATRLQAIADTAREMAIAMDFAFLVDPDRKLLSIGYALHDQRLDPACYDLLASEARLASLFAIAKGDLPTRHWFRLGRAATPTGSGSALISWSGSMFEYLMPSLVMRAPVGSLLAQTTDLVVRRQAAYAQALGVPWGISESAFNARDVEFTYQYANFGVPDLGFKRGLADDLVIAPYATALAAMVDPAGACRNYAHLASMAALGRHGFYEALDFTPARLPKGESVSIVRSYMAHHQGMTIVAIANVLTDGIMRARFHREPMIQSVELLLQERMPRLVATRLAHAEDVRRSGETGTYPVPVRRLSGLTAGPAPVTHLLSNGRYTVMVTAAGAGYSRWRGLSVTRWREDATRDCWGSFVYVRDTRSGQVWSPGAQPITGIASCCDVVFSEDCATFTHRDGGLETTLDVLVSGEDDCEVRRLSLVNTGRRSREVDVTSYAEIALAAQAADEAHPAFAKLFVMTDHLPEFGALIATRRARSPEEPSIWAAHFAAVEGELTAEPQYETDRARFLGRGRDAGTAAAIVDGLPLSNTVGTVLDPVFALRRRVSIPPGGSARVAIWTAVAPSRAELLELIDRHLDRNAFDRAATLAWTQAQVQLRHLGIDPDEAADFQRLAAAILYANGRWRAPADVIRLGAAAQSGLWALGISGDLPIVLLRIDDVEDMEQVRQILRADEYWRMKQLAVDVVILNEHASSYQQELQSAIEAAVRSGQARRRLGTDLPGAVHVLRADLMDAAAHALLRSAARVELIARHGPLADSMARLSPPTMPMPDRGLRPSPPPAHPLVRAAPDLAFFNGLGGFAPDGREYVVRTQAGQHTPAPWINVIANPEFGFQVSADGSSATWSESSRENQLTPWSNDPVSDACGEAIYVQDEASGDFWSPTAFPVRGAGVNEARHGFGYSRFSREDHGIALELLQFVPLDAPVKISSLRIHNRSGTPRRLRITAYTEWVLGTSRGASAPFIVTTIDAASGALMATKPWNTAFADRVAFADLCGRQTAWTADRTEFLGRHGTLAAPAALISRSPLSGVTGAGLDPCSALQSLVELAPHASTEVVILLGQGRSIAQAQALIARWRNVDVDEELATVEAHWQRTLGAIQVRTPDRAMDILLNGWLLYQTIACRLLARSAFYQASGAFGFRDQLQDGMALSFAQPEQTRAHLLRAAGRQFPEGDVQHWWLPHSGQGVRTRISDDRVWLAYATATYLHSSGDHAVLDEMVGFLDGPPLRADQHDAFFLPGAATETATLFEHCARGLEQSLMLTGPNGLPLIGTGDWNDGMNRVGAGGTGESVWLGWLLIRTIAIFAPWAERRRDDRAARWRAHAESVRAAIERVGWDGAWYRRATFDDGAWLGTSTDSECRIDAIAQSWAVLSGAAEPARARQAMDSMIRHLVRPDDGLALLLAPPFDRTDRDPGYIKGYPPGLRENGGQYSHAAMWAILALAALRDGERAWALFDRINPINHARTPADVERYKVEPYVVAADVYASASHMGRGGWTWYTGSAGWMYRAGIEGILGLHREGTWIRIDPCIPLAWPEFDIELNVDATRVSIHVQRRSADDGDAGSAMLDDVAIPVPSGGARVPLDGRAHRLVLMLAHTDRPNSSGVSRYAEPAKIQNDEFLSGLL